MFAYIHIHCEFLSSASYTYSLALALICLLEGKGHMYMSRHFRLRGLAGLTIDAFIRFAMYSRRLKEVDVLVAYRFRSTAVLRLFNFRSTPVLFAYRAH